MRFLNFLNRKNAKMTSGFIAAAFLIMVCFQNCQGGFEALESKVDQPFVEKYDVNCSTNKDFQACVYAKLPDFAGSDFSYQDISGFIGLRISELKVDSELNLVTSHYNALSLKNLSQARWLSNGLNEEVLVKLRQPAAHQDKNLVEKIQALYWGQKVHNFLQENFGPPLDKISFVVDGDKTGWAPENKAIVLGPNSKGISHALDGGVMVHLLGESLFTRATNYQDLELALDEGRHVSCQYGEEPIMGKECCVNQKGCFKSITAGLADYLVTQIFSGEPSIGGFATLNMDGARICGLVRNPALNKNLTLQQAYDACSSNGQPGNVYAMSVLYGSIWYEVGANAAAKGMSEGQLNRTFVRLLSEVKSSDTFASVLQKIRVFDPELASLFSDEYIRRGINLEN